MAQKRAHTKRTTSTEAAGNLTEREKGSFSLLITNISYNACYAKLREVKKAHFPDFCRLSLGWLIFWLGLTVLRILLLPVLCAAESVRLQFFYSSKHLCAAL